VQTLFWIVLGIVGAVIAGTILARGITGPLRELESGARRVAAGDYEKKIALDTKDELSEVAGAFDAMSDEIRAWNAELTERVEERTRELKAAQEQLLEARKLGAMASLSAGVAHEINNPLASVLAFTQLLLSKARKSEGAAKQVSMLETVETEALRINDIVSRMQRLSQEQGEGFGKVSPGGIFDLVLTRMDHALEEASIHVDRRDDSHPSEVRGNREQLATAFEYVVDNAIKAMSGEERKLGLRVRDVEGELVVLEVSDTGRGIAAEHLDRVFEPFYTTKDDWRGVGLGLSLAHRIVTDHGGSIRIDSTLGEGTTVSVTLPASRAEAHLV
jgi:signal transduction histidine kinase